jgi:predicted metal-dependent phosphotriesterase family hydrolase
MNGLRAEGISDADIDLMIRQNPARLLGLDP